MSDYWKVESTGDNDYYGTKIYKGNLVDAIFAYTESEGYGLNFEPFNIIDVTKDAPVVRTEALMRFYDPNDKKKVLLAEAVRTANLNVNYDGARCKLTLCDQNLVKKHLRQTAMEKLTSEELWALGLKGDL